ncbi:Asp-tRNA(Asn)/Glu-tRNA(Gln) amidotransferase subunit GatC [Thiospirillum jenense]|uniref:Aspartyl/glutamyl-tRNA(Asn/Gln) amidotransferase subunit C n=1 Tax=Thiospirillum jenense TaxID=1653858 RepID=A0A839HGE8_9GAMM|nr:Asp-tRNA(Asn)/Glu-tRNA(Gln) amidotransferase subunit GatC [Thiospirillum jenense]MBB1126208.1 Asp-tRNA(Asn)/Glu-tRNA(Gln) amidotransferase subunit GatC [Thiospirillum jenense]
METSTVTRIAELAKLAIAPAECPHYAEELTQILAMIEQMNAVDTAAVTPLAHPLQLTQRLRADQVTELDQRELFQQSAPLTREGFYLVPRVIE